LSTVDIDTEPVETPGLSGDEVSFVAQILAANARWSASIHTAALDGQERASNEWAARYLDLVSALESVLMTTKGWELDTVLYERLGRIVDRQSFWPDHAHEQIERYRERLRKERAEAEGKAA
jgi:hypothetical protein